MPDSLDRRVVVLVVPPTGTWGPPGRSPEAWRLALAEDTYEVLASLDRVDVAIAVPGGTDASLAEISSLTWPNTPVFPVDPANPILAAAESIGPAAAMVAVSHDAPDLPGLLIGKLFRALGSADLALCPSEDGTQVAIGLNIPPAPWLAATPTSPRAAPSNTSPAGATSPLATSSAALPPTSATAPPSLTFDISIAELDKIKPRRHAMAIGPGWHRLRSAGDLARLDPGLEGWDATRAILRRG